MAHAEMPPAGEEVPAVFQLEPSQDGKARSDPPRSDAASPLQLLLEVQELDLSLDRLAYRRRELPERTAVSGLEATTRALEARRGEVAVERDRLAGDQAAVDTQVEAVVARIAAIEERLRSGRAGSFRDEQAMGTETVSLARRRRELEDHEIEIMEALEPFEMELASILGDLDRTGTELAEASESLAAALHALDLEVASVQAERAAVASGLPEELASHYERLRSKLDGVGAARVVAGACGGCHLQIPAAELDRLRHQVKGELAHCDQCGRILVV